MASDDDAEDMIETDDPSDDETQGAAAAAAGRGREGSTGELQSKTLTSTVFITYLVHGPSRSRRRPSRVLRSIEPP